MVTLKGAEVSAIDKPQFMAVPEQFLRDLRADGSGPADQ